MPKSGEKTPSPDFGALPWVKKNLPRRNSEGEFKGTGLPSLGGLACAAV